ncbi:hypothetical protein WT88_29475 [Burkholderia stagnalis]|uniref:RyR domain-containing protein n=1 Tax=Burkholderia stagnalis TaxID=1503054 RepID=UPI0007581EAC|nr:RyR domain-containing protein [Burkholderia stagnalis]KVZ18615.1 hypothetical protein WT35_04415 [Burkholderia stagnalis]KWN32838.1 hypothetical protein WT86_18540 [Burkholderia stagnalis]KWN44665.1 hypothetical protein WT88_29475 [Burkholderia stagnalis]KWN54398.1 hypothetical protein WT87_03570 [Burkholderia stagnalis]KWO68805.1 hypothetical protein WT99_20940 [Burkholderia stagnalis]
MNVTQIARIAHEVNRAYCKSIGDDSHLPWGKASPAERDAAQMSVTAMMRGFQTPEQIHEAWRKELALSGWAHGLRYDPAKKTHPHLVDYASLPLTMRTRDALFLAVMRGAMLQGDPEESAK